ncbi:MAG: F0F1 ATP synthase subunit B' [Proteobacteria bacterium]|nr:F0F1 ATP synthase subunit B' [Pseudomonadota bacterium]
MPQLDPSWFPPQLIWLAISFALLYLLMTRLALPRIGEVLETRQRRIDDNLDRAAEIKQEADRAIAAYEKALAEARAEAHAIMREAGARLAAEAQRRQAELSARLASEAKEAEARVGDAKAAALGEIRGVAAEVARAAAVRLAGIEPDAQTLVRAVEAVMKGRA